MRKLLLILLSFVLFGCGSNVSTNINDSKNIIKDGILYYIVEYKDDSVVLYPGMYEKELHDKQSQDFIEMKLDENIEFYNQLTTIIIDKENNETKDEVNEKVNADFIKEAVEYDSGFVYIEYYDNIITKMSLYGENIVME